MVVEMGFPEDKAQEALQAAHWYMDKAVKRLMAECPPAPPPQAASPVDETDPAAIAAAAGMSMEELQAAMARERAYSDPTGGVVRDARFVGKGGGRGGGPSRSPVRGMPRTGKGAGRGRRDRRGVSPARAVTPAEQQQAVELVMAMGFDEAAARNALLAASWSVELAVQRMLG